jgi:hypothetical protein
MPALTRRRDPEAHHECWHIYFGDICIGWLGERAGVPKNVDQWGWCCGFHPRDRHVSGTAESFGQARADFEMAWRDYLPTCTEADFEANRRQQAWTRWKYEMQETGRKMPTQVPELRSQCFCGVELGIACEEHVYARHMENSDDRQHA